MKNKIISIIFIIIIFGLGLASILFEDKLISTVERRKLAQFPTNIDEQFTENLDEYLIDQFAFRDKFINLNANINRKILQKNDDNDVYVLANNIFEKNYPLNTEKCTKFTEKINYVIDNYSENNNIYYSIIPDKSYFLDNNKYVTLDYNEMYNIVTNNTNGKYIDITNKLNIEDYYKTDIHWKQENLEKISQEIITSMGKEYKSKNSQYTVRQYDNFYGSLYAKAGVKLQPDSLKYLYNKNMENITVKHLEYGNKKVYDLEKLTGPDAYDVFLSGASSYIEITNNNIQDNTTLIIFRDSFSSSLAPLLTPYYNKIIMIDLRYMDFRYLKSNYNFENCDILFLYSTLIINESDILKVQQPTGTENLGRNNPKGIDIILQS